MDVTEFLSKTLTLVSPSGVAATGSYGPPSADQILVRVGRLTVTERIALHDLGVGLGAFSQRVHQPQAVPGTYLAALLTAETVTQWVCPS